MSLTKLEVKRRLQTMAYIWVISGMLSIVLLVVGDFSLVEDANVKQLMQFTMATAFIVHLFGMLAMGILLVGSTIELLRNDPS